MKVFGHGFCSLAFPVLVFTVLAYTILPFTVLPFPVTGWKASYPLPINLLLRDFDNAIYQSPQKSDYEPLNSKTG